jgi:hypothetical protein
VETIRSPKRRFELQLHGTKSLKASLNVKYVAIFLSDIMSTTSFYLDTSTCELHDYGGGHDNDNDDDVPYTIPLQDHHCECKFFLSGTKSHIRCFNFDWNDDIHTGYLPHYNFTFDVCSASLELYLGLYILRPIHLCYSTGWDVKMKSVKSFT